MCYTHIFITYVKVALIIIMLLQRTPLHFAVYSDLCGGRNYRFETVKCLVDHGADLTIKNEIGVYIHVCRVTIRANTYSLISASCNMLNMVPTSNSGCW